MKKSLLVWTVLFIAGQLFAQNEPVISCVESVIGGLSITWINDHAGCGAGFTATNIYQSSSPDGPFSLIASLADSALTSYVDVSAATLNEEVFYYVETDCSGTTAQSSILGNGDPSPPHLVSVSVVGAGAVEITWEPGDFPSSFGTRVFRYISGGPVAIQEIDDFSVTQTIDSNAFPESLPEQYDLTTIDGCGNVGPFTEQPHRTMRLLALGDACVDTLHLNWSAYVGWNEVVEYRILKNGIPVHTSPGNAMQNLYSYLRIPEDSGITCFVIEALSDTGITSLSNEFCVDYNPCFPIGIEALTGLEALNLFPLPFNSSLQMQISLEQTGGIALEVFDNNAKRVYQDRFQLDDGLHDAVVLDLSELSSGIYFVKISGKNFTTSRKVIKR